MGILCFCDHVAFVIPLMLESAIHIFLCGRHKNSFFSVKDECIFTYSEFTFKNWCHLKKKLFIQQTMLFIHMKMTSIYISHISGPLNHLALELIYLAVFMYCITK